jgi:alpha-beta hydrolase superfamily lysophospholipase
MIHPALDQPEVLRVLFHPRPEYHFASQAPGIYPISIEVEPGIAVGGHLYPASPEAPAILCYHGNGEIAADYDGIAPLYTRLDITLLVIDYRGYGISGGHPTASNLVADAMPVFNALDGVLPDQGLAPSRLYVMGRSLGSVPAIEVAVHAGEQLAGLIIESGGWDTVGLMARLGVRLQGGDEIRDGFGSRAKMCQVTIPTLVIHGQNDVLIPATDGQELYHSCAAEDKRLLLIPGAGHNDLMMVGRAQYFGAIRKFVFGEVEEKEEGL